ncbi:alpha/beta hydrolase family esterase, partial [Gemmatimonadota bacterium]
MNRMILRFFVLFVFAFPNSGVAAKAAAIAAASDSVIRIGLNEITLDYDGLSRSVIFHLPSSYPQGESSPVVFAFHGMGGTNQGWPEHLRILIDSSGYIGIYPQGIQRSWNSGSGMEPSKADDVGFVEAILDWLEGRVAIDQNRVYAIGTSNGAALCHRLGLESDRFAAIAAIAATLLEGPVFDANIPKLSVLQIHGELDRVVPYGGGLSESLGISFESARNTVELWARHNGCDRRPEIEIIPGNISVYRYNGCDSSREVLLYSLKNAGHGILRNTAGGL